MEEEKSMHRELEYMQVCKCDQVVTALGVGYIQYPQTLLYQPSADQKAPRLKVPCMLLEHAAFGSLSSFINKVHKERQFEQLGMNQPQTRSIIKQVATGLMHLHDNCIVHRDLKTGNASVVQVSCTRLQFDQQVCRTDVQHHSKHSPV